MKLGQYSQLFIFFIIYELTNKLECLFQSSLPLKVFNEWPMCIFYCYQWVYDFPNECTPLTRDSPTLYADESTVYIRYIPNLKNDQSTKGIIGLGYNILKGKLAPTSQTVWYLLRSPGQQICPKKGSEHSGAMLRSFY